MRTFKRIFTPITFICICYILWCTIEIAVLISGAALSMNGTGRSYSVIESRRSIYTVQNIVGIILYVLFTFDIWKIYFTKQNSVKHLCYKILRDVVLLIPIYLLVLTTIYFILPAFGQPCIGGYLNYTEPIIVMVNIGILSSIFAFSIKVIKHK